MDSMRVDSKVAYHVVSHGLAALRFTIRDHDIIFNLRNDITVPGTKYGVPKK